jgi:hypothetical protein
LYLYSHAVIFTATLLFLQPRCYFYSHAVIFTATLLFLQPRCYFYSHAVDFTGNFGNLNLPLIFTEERCHCEEARRSNL